MASKRQIEEAWLNYAPYDYTFGDWVAVRASSHVYVSRFLVLRHTYLAAYEGPEGVRMTQQNAHLFRLDTEWLKANRSYTSVRHASVIDRKNSLTVSRHGGVSRHSPMKITLRFETVAKKNQWKNVIWYANCFRAS